MGPKGSKKKAVQQRTVHHQKHRHHAITNQDITNLLETVLKEEDMPMSFRQESSKTTHTWSHYATQARETNTVKARGPLALSQLKTKKASGESSALWPMPI